MKFSDSSQALFVAFIAAVSFLQLAVGYGFSEFSPDQEDPQRTCIYACNPKGHHGCRGDCPVCDPVERRCVPKKSGSVGGPAPPPPRPRPPPPSPPPPPPPPTSAPSSATPARNAKCIGTVKHLEGIYIREKPTTKSRSMGVATGFSKIKLTEKVDGENFGGTSVWFKKGNGYVSAKYLEIKNGGPTWCSLVAARSWQFT